MLTETVDSPYSEADCSKFMPSSASGMFNMADTFIRRFIKFCKCMPEFSGLTQADQIALLKVRLMDIQWNLGNMTNHGTDVGWSCSLGGRVVKLKIWG
jgi:hypothetical protein